MFREPMRPSEQQFLDAIARMLERHAAHPPPADLRILVADPQTRILERLSTALGTRGLLGRDGDQRHGGDRRVPVEDARRRADRARHAGRRRPARAPGDGPPPRARERAGDDDVGERDRPRRASRRSSSARSDFIPKPFTVLEVILRARRWARASQRDHRARRAARHAGRARPAVAAPDVRAGAKTGQLVGHARSARRVDRLRRRQDRARAVVGDRRRRARDR